jgi:uncharacterized membrane protein
MRELLNKATELAVLTIDSMALLVVLAGTITAFFEAIQLLLKSVTGHARRMIWMRYARWLVAALTFQLAADILESAVGSDWESLGRLGAIAAIRTFLNYFLERDLDEVRAREHCASAKAATPT